MLKREILIPILFSVYYAGCSTVGSNQAELNSNWGRSFETARHTQIVAHDAGRTQIPVIGLNGEAAILNIDRYNTSGSENSSMPSPEVKINLNSER